MKLSRISLSFVMLAVTSVSCSSPQTKSPVVENQQNLETIAVLGTTDIHGSLVPFALYTREKENVKSTPYEAGGAAILASYIQILRSEFGEHMIWLDAGDEFQGSVESNLEYGKPMVQFFNTMGLNAAAIGNHEFDFGLPHLHGRMKEATYPYLAANISEKKTGRPAHFPNTFPSKIIRAGNLNVGVIGLATLDTPKTTKASHVESFHFENLRFTALREAENLRKLGANIILITAHVGLKCDPPSQNIAARGFRKPTDPQGGCGERDEMVQLLETLPPGTIDGVVSGHSHQVVHQWIAGVPVIQGGAFGRYINVIYLTYDWTQKRIVPDQTRIEGPIPICSKVFQNQNDCNGDRPAPKNGRGHLVDAKFHGKPILPDPKISQIVTLATQRADLIKREKLGTAVRPIEHTRMSESELGNLVADAIRKSANSDFSYMNNGGIRASIESGAITYGDIFRSIPFDNAVVTLQVKENELRNILRVAQSGARGFGSVSGLKLRLIHPSFAAPFEDINGTGTFEPWEANRLLEVTLANGERLDPNRYYTLATLDFLLTGGDDLKWAMAQIPENRPRVYTGILARDALAQYIREQNQINASHSPLIRLDNPRLQFEKPKKKASHPHRYHRKRKTHLKSVQT